MFFFLPGPLGKLVVNIEGRISLYDLCGELCFWFWESCYNFLHGSGDLTRCGGCSFIGFYICDVRGLKLDRLECFFQCGWFNYRYVRFFLVVYSDIVIHASHLSKRKRIPHLLKVLLFTQTFCDCDVFTLSQPKACQGRFCRHGWLWECSALSLFKLRMPKHFQY